MKEMKYCSHQERGEVEILCKDNYRGYTFYVLSLGTHPCAYIVLDNYSPFFRMDYSELQCIECHGGLTYSEDFLGYHPVIIPHSTNHWIIGWDYAHGCDKLGVISDGKEWATHEIYVECLDVIDDIIKKS